MIDLSDHLYNPPGCVGWWRFRDSISVEDMTGTYGAGTFVGTPKPEFATSGTFPFLMNEDGSVCRPMSFPGVAGSKATITAPAAQNKALVGPFFAMTAWLAIASYTNYNGIVGKTHINFPAPFDTYTTQTTGTMNLFANGNGGGTFLNAVSSTVIPLNALTHVGMVYDAQAFKMNFYLNGFLVDSITPTITGSTTPTDLGDPIQIGGRSDDATPFMGYIDDVRIFASETQALSGGEVMAIYASSFNPLPLADMPFGTGGPIGLPSWLYKL